MIGSNQVKIVIPEFGQREHTQNCLLSIDAQEGISIGEVVVGNDGYDQPQSVLTCGTALRVIDWDDNLLFGRNLNRTAGIAFDDGVGNSDIIILSNNDVVFHKDCIFELCSTVLKKGGVHGPLITNCPWWEQDITNSKPGNQYTDCRILSGCCLAMFARHWFELGGFDCESFESYFEENDFCIRARLYGLPVGFTHRARLNHIWGRTYLPWENKQLRKEQYDKSHGNFINKWGKDEGANIDGSCTRDPRIRYRGTGYSKPGNGLCTQ